MKEFMWSAEIDDWMLKNLLAFKQHEKNGVKAKAKAMEYNASTHVIQMMFLL